MAGTEPMRGRTLPPAAGLAMLLMSMDLLSGQACCTLQGFNGNSTYGSIDDFDGLDFVNPQNRTQLQIQVHGSDDWDGWVRNNFITNGPLLGTVIGLNHFYRRDFMFGLGLSAKASSISEVLTIDGASTSVVLAGIHLRANWISSDRKHIFWGMLTHPLVGVYSNGDFPFRTSVPSAVEGGYGNVFNVGRSSGRQRLVSTRFQGRIEGDSNNLYRFDFFGSEQIVIRSRLNEDMIPMVSTLFKFGSLRPIESGLYQTNFPAVRFLYLLVGVGVEYRLVHGGNAVVRLMGYTPVLRWSDGVLPAGFDEKPVLSLTVSRALNLSTLRLRENRNQT